MVKFCQHFYTLSSLMTYWLTWKTVTLPLQVAFKILKYHSPTLADDISCIATFPKAMQAMMNTAYTYSCKWRFKFNADKSCILTIVAKRNKQPTEKTIHLGNSLIPFGKAYNHQGIALNNKTKLGGRIATACKKLFTAYLTIISITNVNPLTMSHLYKTVVRPYVRVIWLWTMQCRHTRGRSTSEYITAWYM